MFSSCYSNICLIMIEALLALIFTHFVGIFFMIIAFWGGFF